MQKPNFSCFFRWDFNLWQEILLGALLSGVQIPYPALKDKIKLIFRKETHFICSQFIE
jgi:hypothetical protein